MNPRAQDELLVSRAAGSADIPHDLKQAAKTLQERLEKEAPGKSILKAAWLLYGNRLACTLVLTHLVNWL